MTTETTTLTASEAFAAEAETLGAKIWRRSKDIGHGIRSLSAKQYENLTADEQWLVRSGWISWAYCNYGCDQKPQLSGQRWTVKKA